MPVLQLEPPVSAIISRRSSPFEEIRLFLRRYPVLDLALASAMIDWGLAAIFKSSSVLYHSHFGSLQGAIDPAGFISLVVGLSQAGVAIGGGPFRRIRHMANSRTVVSFFGFWVLLSLTLAVDSITGRIAWGHITLLEALVCLAVID